MNSPEIFATKADGRKLLAIFIKGSNLDIGRVSGSIAGREWNIGLDLKLKFIMLSITCLKRGQHQILEKTSTDYKLRNLLQFYLFPLLEHISPN